MKVLTREIKKILLIYPNFITRSITDNITIPPLGLETIAACVLDLVDVKIIDAKVRNLTVRDILNEIAQYQPDIIGISCSFTIGINYSLKIAKEAKTQKNRIILGGWHPNFVPTELLQNNFVDIIVRGEGEITFREIIEGKEIEEIKGISYKKAGNIINNPDRPLITDLDTLPYPARQLREKGTHYQIFQLPVDAVESSRGCPYKCTFCNIHLFYRGKYRTKSAERVVNELKIIYNQKGRTNVLITDDNFTANMNRVEKICDLITKNGIKLDLMCQSRLDVIRKNPKIIEKMAEAGFWSFFVGIESFNQRSLDYINKKVQLRDIIQSIKILHQNSIVVVGSMLVGANLEEKREDTDVMIKIVKKIGIDFPIYSIMTPLPGTKFREILIDKGYLLSENWSQYNFTTAVNRLKYLSKPELEYLLFRAYYKGYFNRSWKNTIIRLIKKRGFSLILQTNVFKVLREGLDFLNNIRRIKDGLEDGSILKEDKTQTFQI
ncbi:MAG: radical SAM protein [Candidatus Lokiarchaeota archaeon]|nr:radical SAM protein [Candidatus Lokiarchaeota archaeon]MBD3200312.1 radical SAM protein [Candidatus Lokiarchaeota archaeon]